MDDAVSPRHSDEEAVRVYNLAITRAQNVLANYLEPDSSIDEDEAIGNLLHILDHQDLVKFQRGRGELIPAEAIPRCDKLDGSSLSIVPGYTEAGRLCEANCITVTDGEREAIYIPFRAVA